MQTNATAVANKWATNLANSTDAVRAGVQAVTVAPTQAAANAQAAYIAGVQKAVSNGKWQAGLSRVSLSDWQNAMVNKGIPRIGTGAQAAKPKFTAFMQQFLPYVQQGQQQLASQPRGDLNTNIQRAVFMMNWNSQFKRQGQ